MVQLMLGAYIYFWKTSKFIIFELRRLQKNFFGFKTSFCEIVDNSGFMKVNLSICYRPIHIATD
jgi:hypothetical protein